MTEHTWTCENCGETALRRDYHICPATCPNGVVGCPGPGVAVVTHEVCQPCRAARLRVVLPLEGR